MKNEVKLKTNYFCPACGSFLRVWNNIILIAKSSTGEKKGILLLNPSLGNFSVTAHSSLQLEQGEKVDFLCPVCHKNLAATDINENLIRISMTDLEDKHYDVYFSRICGQQSTFKISDNNIIEKFGKDDSHYVNYFLSKFHEQSI